MNKTYIAIAIVIVLGVVIFLYTNNKPVAKKDTNDIQVSTRPDTEYKLLDAKDFKEAYENDSSGVLLDVRTKEEFTKGHLSAAKNIDVQSPQYEIELRRLDPKTPYYVYCQSGNRSQTAVATMKKLGFTKAYELRGGITSWQQANFPVAKSL